LLVFLLTNSSYKSAKLELASNLQNIPKFRR
jgi:hypothetical protein